MKTFLMQLNSYYSLKKCSITAWLIFLLSVEYFSYLMRQMKGPQSVERRECRKHKSKGRYFAPWVLLCCSVLGSCLPLLPSPQTLCSVLSQGRSKAQNTLCTLPTMDIPLALSLLDACRSCFKVIHD